MLVMETLELCRLCALEKDNLLGIYDSEGITLDAKIKKCLNIEVSEKENLPKSICIDCYAKLDAFDEFLDNSINAQATLSILYSDKGERLSGLNLSDEELKSEEEYEDQDDSFMLDHVPTSEELDIGKPQFLDNKTFPDSSSGNLEHCNGSTVENNILSAVDDEFIQNKTDSEERVEEGSDGDGDMKTKEWENPSSWLCSDCSEQFSDVTDLRHHHRTEHNQDARYMCDYCSKLFVEFQSFLSHLRRHKSSLKYSCEVCGKVFSNKKVIEAHRLVHSDMKPYGCGECGKSFRQQSALFVHSRCHLPDDVKNKYPCELCNKRFSTKPNLVTHMRIHSGVRNFTCDQCGKSFVQKGNLDAHLLTHSHDKPFECGLCSKRFKTGMQLRKHHSVHTGAKPHQCDVCGRTFREKGTLREHHRIHTGAMPFTCEYCGKAFRFKGILTTHRRQHTGERPYSCLECQHHFTNWPNYNKHMKRRHGINTSRSTRSDKSQTTIGQVQPTPPPVSQAAPPPPPPIHQQPQPPAHVQHPPPDPLYQEIQPGDLYTNLQPQTLSPGLPTYMAYNVYSLSQVTSMDGSTIEIVPRQAIALKETPSTATAINFQT